MEEVEIFVWESVESLCCDEEKKNEAETEGDGCFIPIRSHP
jgi:hypothetical protein